MRSFSCHFLYLIFFQLNLLFNFISQLWSKYQWVAPASHGACPYCPVPTLSRCSALKAHRPLFFQQDLVAASCQCMLLYPESSVTMERLLLRLYHLFFFCIRYMQNPFLEKELLLSSTLSALSPLEKFNELVSFHKWTLELGLVAL